MFLERIKDYIAFFIGEIGGRGTTPLEVKALAEARRILPRRSKPTEPSQASSEPS
jgi:hypothetical protein